MTSLFITSVRTTTPPVLFGLSGGNGKYHTVKIWQRKQYNTHVWWFWISFNTGWLQKNGSCWHKISWKASGAGVSLEGGTTGQGRSPTSLGRPPCPSLHGALLTIQSHWCSSNTASDPEKELMAAVSGVPVLDRWLQAAQLEASPTTLPHSRTSCCCLLRSASKPEE